MRGNANSRTAKEVLSMETVKTALITGYGINAQEELKEAFDRAGSDTVFLHVKDIIDAPNLLARYHILGFPGGFSFGDHLGSGLVFANLCREHLFQTLTSFIEEGKLIIGICNGFQVLVKMGLLPNINGPRTQEVSLIDNCTGVFENSWVDLTFPASSNSVWTKNLPDMELPIRHGEGRFIADSEETLRKLQDNGHIAVRYKTRNPNGSEFDIAGITDITGRVLGIMPHPEAYLYPENHPRWTRSRKKQPEEHTADASPPSLRVFQNGVDYMSRHISRNSSL